MIDESVLNDDFKESILAVWTIKEFLELLYKDPEIATPFNKPVIGTLITACDYLSTNLPLLRAKIIKS